MSETFDNIKKVFVKDKPEFTAEYAWLETTYGTGTYRNIDQRIKDKQDYIRNLIRSKFPLHGEGINYNKSGSYRCVIDIEEDLMCGVDEVFKPFLDGGFKIINLSEQVKEISEDNVYLISWKKVFKDHLNQENKEENEGLQ